jgi:hypothetical protein
VACGGRRSVSAVEPIARGSETIVHESRYVGGPVVGGEMCFRCSRGIPLKVEDEPSDHELPAATSTLSGRPKRFGASNPARRKLLRRLTGRGVVARVRSGAMTWPLKSGSSTRMGGWAASTRQAGSVAPTDDSKNTRRAYTRPAFQRSMLSLPPHTDPAPAAASYGPGDEANVNATLSPDEVAVRRCNPIRFAVGFDA